MTIVFKLADKVAAFTAKLKLWERQVDKGIFDMFRTLVGILDATAPEQAFSQLMYNQLSLLIQEFKRYLLSSKTHELQRNDGFVIHWCSNQEN